MLRSHRTPRYIVDRLGVMLWQRANPGAPWLVPGAVAFLHDWLKPHHTLFEFGSGRSTLWFAQRAGRVESFEAHPEWYERVRATLPANVGYHLIDPANVIDTADAALAGPVDAALVDGIERDRCAMWAVEHVRPGGIVIVDNVNRYLPCGTRSPESLPKNADPASDLWRTFAAATIGWTFDWWTNGVTDTAIWTKPAHAPAS